MLSPNDFEDFLDFQAFEVWRRKCEHFYRNKPHQNVSTFRSLKRLVLEFPDLIRGWKLMNWRHFERLVLMRLKPAGEEEAVIRAARNVSKIVNGNANQGPT